MAGGGEGVGGVEAAEACIVVAGLEVVEAEFSIIDIAAKTINILKIVFIIISYTYIL